MLVKYAEGFRAGGWGLPGRLDFAARIAGRCGRHAGDTGVTDIYLSSCAPLAGVDRYPGSRVVTIAFTALVRQEDYVLIAGAATSAVHWRPVSDCPDLALDHSEIFARAAQPTPSTAP